MTIEWSLKPSHSINRSNWTTRRRTCAGWTQICSDWPRTVFRCWIYLFFAANSLATTVNRKHVFIDYNKIINTFLINTLLGRCEFVMYVCMFLFVPQLICRQEISWAKFCPSRKNSFSPWSISSFPECKNRRGI